MEVFAVPAAGHAKMMRTFREYLVNGGMPEAVSRFFETGSFGAAHDVQAKILASNLDDIARYATNAEKPKIRACYLSLPAQLARENKKFKFSTVEHGGSARKFGNSVDWLRESSLALQCHNLSEPAMPLSVYSVPDIFKMYVSDVGILCAMMGFQVKKSIVDDTLDSNSSTAMSAASKRRSRFRTICRCSSDATRPPQHLRHESTTTMNGYAYSAKLVFKVTGMPKEHGRWLCEERIIRLTARNHEAAYEKAVRAGWEKALRGWRFVGVANLIRHDPILDGDEVWYELKTSKEPERLVPPKRIVLKNLARPSSSTSSP